MEFQLTKNQQAIFDRIEADDTTNFLVQGKPGVGKSVLINALVENGRKSYSLAAPTGLAALNIGGRTLHSIFKIPISTGIMEHDFNRFAQDDRIHAYIKFQLKYLIIDEISMVRADTFDFIDRMLKAVRQSDKPFGGVQLILVGDFYQLPPVVIGFENKQLKEAGYASPFVFSSRAFANGNFEVLSLHEVLRQRGDPLFIEILDAARTGEVTDKQLAILNKCVSSPDDLRIKLCGTNKQADEINQAQLRGIDSPSHSFTSDKFGDWPALPADEFLTLKVGAQVMVKLNGADRPPTLNGKFDSKVVNGTLGKVTNLDKPNEVVIELEDGTTATIYRKRWERKIKEKQGDQWEERIVASYSQIPLALAWAISIHKSQGQSFDKVYIDASKIFAAGQLYVALSRCRSISGLALAGKLTKAKFWPDRHVMEFFETVTL